MVRMGNSCCMTWIKCCSQSDGVRDSTNTGLCGEVTRVAHDGE